MQRHVSYNKDAVIESPLHLLLLIKLLIVFRPFFTLQMSGLQKNFVRQRTWEEAWEHSWGGRGGGVYLYVYRE